MPVTKRTRYEVLKRDNHTCRYCGGVAPDAILTVDHVTPIALGGTDDPSNLVAACRDCNYGKSSTSPDAAVVEDVSQDAMRWAAAMKLAAERVAAREEPMYDYVRAAEVEVEGYGGETACRLPVNWRDSVDQFYRAGLPIEGLRRAFAIAMTKDQIAWSDKWRYTCGVAWSMIREIREEAECIVTAEGE